MVENSVEEDPNMTVNGLNEESLSHYSKHVQDIENNDEPVMIENSVENETINGGDITGNISNEESGQKNLSENREYNKNNQIMEEHVSDQEDTNKSNKENIEKIRKSKKCLSKSSGSKRLSKKQIKEERMKIRSETHRLMREREISIPYHVPKKRTLKEFLARKKNLANIPLNMPSSKMIEIWKDIEESTKNAFEFFKSDSESDVENNSSSEKLGKINKKIEGKEDGKVKGYQDSDNSNNNNNIVESSCNTFDKIINENEDVNLNLTIRNLEIENCKNEDNMLNESSTMFLCEDTVMEVNDLDGGEGKCLTRIQEVEDSPEGLNDDSAAADNTSKLVIDMNQNQSENHKIDNNEDEQNENYARQRTSDWVKDILAFEKLRKQKNKKETLLQKLNPKLLKITPKLSGESDSYIDLENDKSIVIGAKNLKKRFIENCIAPRSKPKTDSELTIMTCEKSEEGEIKKIATEKLIYTSAEVLNDPDLDKPGAKIQRLREELKKKIEEKWEEEYRKKMEEMKIEAEKKKIEEENDVEDEEELIDDDEIEDSEDTSESEPEEDDIVITESKRKKNIFIDNEAEESEYEGEESGNEGGDELDDNEGEQNTGNDCSNASVEHPECSSKDGFNDNEYGDSQSSLIPPYQPGGGMLHGGSELTQNDEDISLPKNILSPTLRLSLDFSQSTKITGSQQPWDIDLESPEESNTKNNFVPCFPESKNFDLTDAYELCSGKFPGEGGESQESCRGETNSQESVVTSIKDSQLDSNTFDSLIVKETEEVDEERENGKKKRSRLRIVSDESDDEIVRPLDDLNELEDITKGRLSPDSSSEKSLPIRHRVKRKNLVFSDEEDDGEMEKKIPEESEEESELEDDVKDNEEEEEDSSQNEEEEGDEGCREIEYDSEEAEIVNMGEYFEKEAELSGSEWSGDEDERDLDEYDVEEGDADKLDEKKVRSELEKIHMRTLLDDDAREVRLLQEILFEDGDLFDDGPKRERNFRWKDLGTFFDEDGNDENDTGKSQCQEDMEEDEETRKIRHEKELFLLQMKSKQEEMGLDEDEYETSLLKRGRVIMKRSTVNTTKTMKMSEIGRTEVDEVNFKSPLPLPIKRGSFLSRNEEFLARLAKFTSNATDNILGPKHSKHFIFASKMPEKEIESTKENSHPKRKNIHLQEDHIAKKKAKLVKAPTTSKISVLDRLT